MTALSELDDETLDSIVEKPSEFIRVILDVEPFTYQKQFLDSEGNRKSFVSGRQVGKSRALAWLALHRAVTHPDENIVITAPSARQAKEIYRQIKREIKQSDFTFAQILGNEDPNETECELPLGGRIMALPCSGETIRGVTAGCVIVDEAAFVPHSLFTEVLSPMLATTGGDYILASTPYGKSGFLFDTWTDEDWHTTQAETEDNPLVDEGFIAEQKSKLTEQQYKQEILGEFVESADRFFPRRIVEPCYSDEPSLDSNSRTRYLGVDLASSGDDRRVYTGIDETGHVFHLSHETDGDLVGALDTVKNLHSKHDFDAIHIDATGLGDSFSQFAVQEIGSEVVEGVTFTASKKEDLMQQLKRQFETASITLPAHERSFAELLDMQYEQGSRGTLKIHHPEGGHDDFVDSLALAVDAKESDLITDEPWDDMDEDWTAHSF